jgi:hypothetical protein
VAHPLLLTDNMNSNHHKGTVEVGDKKGKAGTNLTSIKGIVIPTDWDKKGNVVSVAISTFNEDEYLVDRNEKGAELIMRFIRQEVDARGILRKEGNRQIVTVKEILPNPRLSVTIPSVWAKPCTGKKSEGSIFLALRYHLRPFAGTWKLADTPFL